jgi:hypothetical protein
MSSELPPPVRAELDRVLTSRSSGAGPLTITFATADFAPLLSNWLVHAARSGEAAPLVVALDGALAEDLVRAGVPVVRHPGVGSLADLWLQRVLFFEYLTLRGVDFIHSDVDAVWLRDPRPLCFANAGLDLVFSQGADYPAEIWRQWGFVLCCGLFAVRASPATAAFFAAVRSVTARVGDDQVVVNHFLAEHGLVWNTEETAGYTLVFRDKIVTAWRRMLTGISEGLNLRIGMLPHHLASRIPDAARGAYIRHPIGPGSPKEKAVVLRDAGCWASESL